MSNMDAFMRQELAKGVDPDTLMAMIKAQVEEDLETRLHAAAAEVNAAKEDETLDNARDRLVQAVLDYGVALGAIDAEDVTEKDVEQAYEMLEGFEKLMTVKAGLRAITKEEPKIKAKATVKELTPEQADEIMKNFLRGLV